MFTIYGPGFTDPIRLERLLERPKVAKLEATAASSAISPENMRPVKESNINKAKDDKGVKAALPREHGSESYQAGLKAEQMMMTPVLTVRENMPALEAWKMFDEYGFRHLPVLSEQGELVGMLSERDLMHCRCGEEHACLHCHPEKFNALVGEFMQHEVIAAHLHTAVRAIAQVLLEKRIGAMPIVEGKRLLGLITRSDILRSIMHGSHLNVWM